MKTINVILANNNRNFRIAIRQMLFSFNEVEVIGEASNGIDLLNIMKANQADIVFMDYEMPNMNGLEATRIAMEKYPELTIIGLTSFDEKLYIKKMIEAGAKTCISRNKISYEFIKSIITEKQNEINNFLNIASIDNKLKIKINHQYKN